MDNLEKIQLKEFGDKVRKLRKMIGISIEELSFRSGLHRNYISDVERGQRNISLIAIHKLAYGLGVEIEVFFIQ